MSELGSESGCDGDPGQNDLEVGWYGDGDGDGNENRDGDVTGMG